MSEINEIEILTKLTELTLGGFKNILKTIDHLILNDLKPTFDLMTDKMQGLFDEMAKIHDEMAKIQGQLKLLNREIIQEAIQQTIQDNQAQAFEEKLKRPIYG